MHPSVAGFTGTCQTIVTEMQRLLGPIPKDAKRVSTPWRSWEQMLALDCGTMVDEPSIETAWLVYQDARGATFKDRITNAAMTLHNEHRYTLEDSIRLVQLAARWTGKVA